jgi:glycine C-acetyltransferase
MDGDIAPLPKLLGLAEEYDCLLMIDEAHATGVLGKKGRGALEYFNIKPNSRIIQMGTLSKAVGSFGAYVCGSKELTDFLINKARSLIYTTALPVSIAAASIEGLKIIQNCNRLRKRLWKNVDFFKKSLNNLGFDTGNSQTQIIPVIIKDTQLTMKFSKKLFEEGIFVQGIRPPTVPQGEARLRVTIMATHTRKDLEFALNKFKKVGKKLNFI